MKSVLFIAIFLVIHAANSFGIELSDPVPASRYGIRNDGSLISQSKLDAWLNECRRAHSPVYFPAGKYLLPANFEYDFGNNDLSILGDGRGKTVLTTNRNAATNFAIPEKIDLTKSKALVEGVYQVDLVASTLHSDFRTLQGIELNSYIEIKKGLIYPVSLSEVKALGYITELDTREPDPGIDGLYVVAKHPAHDYGGGFAHLTLGYNGAPLYVQGTILQRSNGIWSRYYSSVAFISQGNFSVKNMSFKNFRPYLFLPSSKKPQQELKTSNFFIIENCSFQHTARVLATMAYAGILESENWYKASSYYSINWNMRFKQFIIKGSEFSYIHETIVWGAPPCSNYTITNNKVHDCYTMLNCFYLFPQYNTKLPDADRTRFSITNNSFIRLRALNPGSENTVHLVRTLNKGSITCNSFVDCTGIQLYLGGSTVVKGNTIRTYMAAVPAKQTRPPVILVKGTSPALISILNNKISMGMMGNLVANESPASFYITNNTITGPGTRYITTSTTDENSLDIYKTYIVQDVDVLKRTAGKQHYDPAIQTGNTVYYNKRNYRWETLTVVPYMYLYGEVNSYDQYKQDVRFTGNNIQASCLVRIQKKNKTSFNSVSFENNFIQSCSSLLAGNENTVIESFNLLNNIFSNCSLNMTSLGKDAATTIRALNVSRNTFFTEPANSYSFTSLEVLNFNMNSFKRKESKAGSILVEKPGNQNNLAASTFQLYLNGYPGQQMMILENNFITANSTGNAICITDPDKVTIANNSFDLTIPSVQLSSAQKRQAIFFNVKNTVTSINIEQNKYLPEQGKENFLVSFDDSHSDIINFSNSGNTVITNEAAITKTISAGNKSFANYKRGKNSFRDK